MNLQKWRWVLATLVLISVLSSCWTTKEIITHTDGEVISVTNERNIKNSITVNNKLYSKTWAITFHNPEDIEKFENDLKEINKKIKDNSWVLTYRQVVEKARLLDYLGKTWEALKLYVNNFNSTANSLSVAYNHNMAKLYEKAGAYKEALLRYWFLIEYYKRKDYYKDMSRIFEKMWETEKAKKAMDWYKKTIKKKAEIEVKELKVSEDWVLEIN